MVTSIVVASASFALYFSFSTYFAVNDAIPTLGMTTSNVFVLAKLTEYSVPLTFTRTIPSTASQVTVTVDFSPTNTGVPETPTLTSCLETVNVLLALPARYWLVSATFTTTVWVPAETFSSVSDSSFTPST